LNKHNYDKLNLKLKGKKMTIGQKDTASYILSDTAYNRRNLFHRPKPKTSLKNTLIVLGITALATYTAGNILISNDLSDKLDPLRAEFESAFQEPNKEIRENTLKMIINAKNEYSQKNHAIPQTWFSPRETHSKEFETPGPISYAFLDAYARLFGYKPKIDDASITNYLESQKQK
jgi:hypothetical protein